MRGSKRRKNEKNHHAMGFESYLAIKKLSMKWRIEEQNTYEEIQLHGASEIPDLIQLPDLKVQVSHVLRQINMLKGEPRVLKIVSKRSRSFK